MARISIQDAIVIGSMLAYHDGIHTPDIVIETINGKDQTTRTFYELNYTIGRLNAVIGWFVPPENVPELLKARNDLEAFCKERQRHVDMMAEKNPACPKCGCSKFTVDGAKTLGPESRRCLRPGCGWKQSVTMFIEQTRAMESISHD